MATKKDYIHLIRWSCTLDSFINHYFIRIIVIYLLASGVTPWVAVSIPIVLEFARLISRGFKSLVSFALQVDYKKYHIFHFMTVLMIGVFISQCRSVYTICFLTLLSGILSGIKCSTVTKMNTQNKEYEPYCLIEEERSQVIGGTLGLLVSQFVYDISPKLYLVGYLILIPLGLFGSLFLTKIPSEDVMKSVDEEVVLDKKSKQNVVLTTTLFGIIAGLWCMAVGGFGELAPLISKKIGYLEAIYTSLELVLLFLISGSVIQKIKDKKKLLFSETVIACFDILCLLLVSVTLSWKGLFVAYMITGITSTLGEPLWGSIMSAYSMNDRTKYVLVNRVYFIVRASFTILTWLICRECVIHGVESFRYLAIGLLALIIPVYWIASKVNRKVFKDHI